MKSIVRLINTITIGSRGMKKINIVVTSRKKHSLRKVITIDNINPQILQMDHSIRGSIYTRALEIEKELEEGVHKPFSKVIKTHIGDCHALGQTPLTFVRQVLAYVSYPELMLQNVFPQDVKDRAVDILSACVGKSIGSYSSDVGYDTIRRSVADFLEKRDGFKANSDNIYLTPGALVAIKGCLQLLINNINGKKTGVMLPTPHHAFYSSTLTEYGLAKIDYYLEENDNWQVTEEELERSFEEGCKTSNVRALVMINPGNPSGQNMSRDNIETLIKFAQSKSLFIFADEVYQHNIYEGEFNSCKKIMMSLGNPYSQTELVSFMSASHGYAGEAGLRGGWMEMVNMDPGVQYHLYKCISARLCPSTIGQAVISCISKPPVKGEPSYELYYKEKSSILKLLTENAILVEDIFNKIEGFGCNKIQGGLYAFPRIKMPRKAIKAAKGAGLCPDVFYALKLLEETGICVVPGSKFGQEPDTYHFRMTILPHPELLRDIGYILQKYHEKFINDFS